MCQSVACMNEGSVFSDIGIVDHAGFLHRQHQKVVLNDEEHPLISRENHIVGRVMSFIAKFAQVQVAISILERARLPWHLCSIPWHRHGAGEAAQDDAG